MYAVFSHKQAQTIQDIHSRQEPTPQSRPSAIVIYETLDGQHAITATEVSDSEISSKFLDVIQLPEVGEYLDFLPTSQYIINSPMAVKIEDIQKLKTFTLSWDEVKEAFSLARKLFQTEAPIPKF